MPKNSGKGGKNNRKGKNKTEEVAKRELLIKENGQEYGQVTKILGNCRIEIYCFDGQNRMGHIRGNFRKKIWISRGDIVLIGLRDYQDTKCDIIHKYTSDEARRLKNNGIFPKNIVLDIGSEALVDATNENIDFDDNFEESNDE
jgi:translation initiation factor 1A